VPQKPAPHISLTEFSSGTDEGLIQVHMENDR